MGLESELGDGVLTLRLNRPHKLNAIDRQAAAELHAAVTTAATDEAVRAIVLCGAGKAFCAGRDVSEPPTEDDLSGIQQVASAMVRCGKPIVAAVHGWVVGGGLEWMLDADVVVAARGARFRLPEAGLGVFVTGGLSAILPGVAGLSRAKAMMLLGEEFSAQQAQAWGLVWAVVDDDRLLEEARRIARRLAALEPRVVSRFKRVLNDVGLPLFDRAVDLECEMQRELMKGP